MTTHTGIDASPHALAGLAAHAALGAGAHWIPEGPGKWSRPLRFLGAGRGFVELMRLEPGVIVPLHRHTGEVHAFNLEGHRRLSSGETIGPGDYVYEPAGNVDGWQAVGTAPLVVFVVVLGEVEFLAPDGTVARRVSATTQLAAYRQYCRDAGLAPLALEDP
jgi:quercetin dioxygenase-like cupin family protein